MERPVGAELPRSGGAAALTVDDTRSTPKEAQVMAQRREKVERLRASGADPFWTAFPDRVAIAEIHSGREVEDGTTRRAAGRLVARRDHGRIVFMDLRDGSGDIEVLCVLEELGDAGEGLLAEIDVGDFIGVEGSLGTSRRGERVLNARSLSVLAKALLMPPKRGTEQKLQQPNSYELKMIANDDYREMLRTRHRLTRFLRGWFDAQGFLEIDTPVLLPHAAGASARPFVARGNALDSGLYLRIAPEQSLKRACIGGFERVYELGRCFRNEGVSKRHHFEFTLLEFLQAYRGYHDTMDLIEVAVSAAAEQVAGRVAFERDGRAFDLTPPWRRITVRDAIREETGLDVMSAGRDELARAAGVDEEPLPDWPDLVAAVYSRLVEPNILQPTFVIDFPRELFPLGKRHTGAPELSQSFEAIVAGVEISSGATNQNDPDEQRAAFVDQRARAKDARDDDDGLAGMDEVFLSGLAYGMPPLTGGGLGLDRILMLLMERRSVHEAIPFPTLYRR